MNFFEEQKKENDLKKKSFDKINESINKLNNLSEGLQEQQKQINYLIEKLDSEQLKKELDIANKTLSIRINDLNDSTKKIENAVDEKTKKYFLVCLLGPAIIIIVFLLIGFYQIKEIKKIENNLIRQENDLNSNFKSFIELTSGQEKYWYSKQDKRAYLDKINNIKKYKKHQENKND